MDSLVTGGAGFIGSHLVEKLIRLGHKVTVLDNFSTGRVDNLEHLKKHINLVECDLSIPGDWSKNFKNKQWVFHLAALADIVPSIQMPDAYFRANVIGTFNVLQACTMSNIERFIYTASSSCYGIPDIYPTPETAEIRMQYPYALTKRLGEELVMHWSQIYDLSALSLRLFNVYGIRSRTSGTYGAVFGVFLAQKLANQPLTIVGDGTQTRDFTYVSDVIEAVITAVESDKKNTIYNIGSGKTVSVNKLVELLSNKKVFIPKRPGEPNCTFADIGKITNELGWNPKISIEDGVKELLKDIEYWRNAPVWNPESIKEVTQDWFHYLSNSN